MTRLPQEVWYPAEARATPVPNTSNATAPYIFLFSFLCENFSVLLNIVVRFLLTSTNIVFFLNKKKRQYETFWGYGLESLVSGIYRSIYG